MLDSKKAHALDVLAKQVFKQNVAVGWWDDMDRCVLTTLQLVSTELAEATEGVRKSLKDDHLPNYPMEYVEIADCFIRVLDLAGRYGWNVQAGTWGGEKLIARKLAAPAEHFVLTCSLVNLANRLDYNHLDAQNDRVDAAYSKLLANLFAVAESRGFSLFSLAAEKMEYNRHRQDHKRTERAKTNGKSF